MPSEEAKTSVSSSMRQATAKARRAPPRIDSSDDGIKMPEMICARVRPNDSLMTMSRRSTPVSPWARFMVM